jgi:hypothetical protein
MKEGKEIDLIGTNDILYKILSSFDLSCCQIGILIDKNIVKTYVTPLFLFTMYTKNIITQIDKSEISYTITSFSVKKEKGKISTSQLYEKHRKGHINKYSYVIPKEILIKEGFKICEEYENIPFHQCHECLAHIFVRRSDDSFVLRWMRRVQKYSDRFPEFQFIFTGRVYDLNY